MASLVVALLLLVASCFSSSSELHRSNQYAISNALSSSTNSDCPSVSMIRVSLSKTNPLSDTEACKVTTSAGIVVLIIEPSTSSTITNTCVEPGNYILQLIAYNNASWNSTSYASVQVTLGTDTYTIMRYRLQEGLSQEIPLSLNFPVRNVELTTSKLYLASSTIPSNWCSDSFQPSGWSSYVASSRPTITTPFHFLYATFSTPSPLSYQSFELRIRGNAGIVAVINGHEVFRTNLPSGEITNSTRATLSSSITGYSVMCDLSILLRDVNRILIIFISHSQQGSFVMQSDMTIRLETASNLFPRLWDFSSYGNRNDGSSLYDMDISTYYYESRDQLSKHSVTLTFENNRFDFVNSYCLVTSPANQNADPMAWTLEGVNSTGVYLLDSRNNSYFWSRQNRYYFYIPSHVDAFPSYRFTFSQNRQGKGGYFALAEIELLTADLRTLQLPSFSISPSTLHLIVGMSFTSPSISSALYSRFSVRPDFPKGLILSANDGLLWGIPEEASPLQAYTISAETPLGDTVETVIQLSTELCSAGNVQFEITTVCKSNCNSCALNLIRASNQQSVFSLTSLLWGSVPYSFCEAGDVYSLHVTRYQQSSCYGFRAHVIIEGQFPIATFSLQTGEMEGNLMFDPRRLVTLESSWKYLVTYSTPPEGWNSPRGFVESWDEAIPGEFPQASGVTQFYAIRFSLDSLADIVGLRFSAVIYAGAVFYLNGEELARVNLPETPITSSTSAVLAYETPTWVSVGETMFGGRIDRENVFAVELHTTNFFEETPSFAGIVTFLRDTSDMIFNGNALTEPSVSSAEAAFDNDLSTEVVFPETCEGSSIIWRYINAFEVVNSYTIFAGDRCWMNYPTSWSLEASQNGKKWFPLHRARNQTFLANSQIGFDFYNAKAYRMYRLSITGCNKVDLCEDGKMVLSDLSFHVRNIAFDCFHVEYPPGLYGQYTFIECPTYAEGYIALLCTLTGYELSEFACSSMEPGEFQYPVNSVVLEAGKEMDALVPWVESWGHSITVNPMLPEGLVMDASTGVISGKPRVEMGFTEYVIELKNSKGTKQATLWITVKKGGTSGWVLLWEVVVVVVMIGVVVWVMRVRKASTRRKSLPVSV